MLHSLSSTAPFPRSSHSWWNASITATGCLVWRFLGYKFADSVFWTGIFFQVSITTKNRHHFDWFSIMVKSKSMGWSWQTKWRWAHNAMEVGQESQSLKHYAQTNTSDCELNRDEITTQNSLARVVLTWGHTYKAQFVCEKKAGLVKTIDSVGLKQLWWCLRSVCNMLAFHISMFKLGSWDILWSSWV